MTVLNNDYRKLNADFNSVVPAAFRPLGADVEIAFCKATRTPAGAATTGITRKSVGSSFVFEDSYYLAAGELAWDPTKYLNIWFGRFSDNTLLGFLLIFLLPLDRHLMVCVLEISFLYNWYCECTI
ncbi:MAG: hypothetical protein IPP77_16000 [Bacteroidetes bacterium]|nr:hypothetical protein [Bacteroidota bacterium]